MCAESDSKLHPNTADIGAGELGGEGHLEAVIQPGRPDYGLRTQKTVRLLSSVWREHELLVATAGAYVLLGGLVQWSLGRPWPVALSTRGFGVLWLGASLVYLLAILSFRRNQFISAFSSARLLGVALVYCLVLPVQITFQALKQSIGPTIGFRWDEELSHLDQVLHFGLPYRFALSLDDGALKALDALYFAWFAALLVVAAWWCWSGSRAWRQRVLLSWLLLWIVGGTVAAWMFSSAGPCYFTAASAGPDYTPLLERLDGLTVCFARRNQIGLWAARQADQWLQFGGISAMPSMHVAFAVLVARSVAVRSGTAAVFAWLYALAIQIGSVALGWHYAVDGYIGAALSLGCWSFAGWMLQRRRGVPRIAERATPEFST